MPDSTQTITLVAASTRTDDELAALFGAVYADYFVPVHLDAIALRTMVRRFDLDLGASRIALDRGRAVAVALLGLRGASAWVGGMGVVPESRRTGLGRRVMEAVIAEARARDCSTLQLEVLEQNIGASALYRELGFRAWRKLDVWALDAPLPDAGAREIPAAVARAWIAARREAPEPWQRQHQRPPLQPQQAVQCFRIQRQLPGHGARVGERPGLPPDPVQQGFQRL